MYLTASGRIDTFMMLCIVRCIISIALRVSLIQDLVSLEVCDKGKPSGQILDHLMDKYPCNPFSHRVKFLIAMGWRCFVLCSESVLLVPGRLRRYPVVRGLSTSVYIVCPGARSLSWGSPRAYAAYGSPEGHPYRYEMTCAHVRA